MLKTLRIAAFAAGVALAATGGEIVISPDGMSPHDALLAIRAAKADGDKGAWTVRVKDRIVDWIESIGF